MNRSLRPQINPPAINEQPQYQNQNDMGNYPQNPVSLSKNQDEPSNFYSLISQKPKYKIDPNILPHPSEFEESYINYENTDVSNSSIYWTNIGSHPPHPTSDYIVQETQNSSCRFIRSSLIKFPLTQGILNASNLMFGLYCQPFAELHGSEDKIPVIENTSGGILRCRRCNAYINSKYKIIYTNKNKPCAVCNICHCNNELDTSQAGVKPEYMSSAPENCVEFRQPTVDFKAPDSLKINKNDFLPHYLIMIDISKYSYDMNFPNYVLSSFQNNWNNFHNGEHSFIGFSTFEAKGVHMYSLDKNQEICVTYMNDWLNPFCPVSRKKLFFNVTTQQHEINVLIEKINQFITHRRETDQNNVNQNKSNIPGTALAAGVDAWIDNGGRVMLFTCSPNNSGFGASTMKDNSNTLNTEFEKELYLPQHTKFTEVIQTANAHRIAVDQFIFTSNHYDLATTSLISTHTGGVIQYYHFSPNSIDYQNNLNLNIIYDKLFYDVIRVISRPNYYDIKVMLRHSWGIEVIELLSAINKKNTTSFSIASCDPDTAFTFNLYLNETFVDNQNLDFQLVVLYTDNYNEKYLRTFNYTIQSCSNINSIFSSVDIDTLIKVTLMKEASNIYTSSVPNIRERLMNKIVNMFYFYKKETSKSNSAQIALPGQVKYLPVYVNSFYKKGIVSHQRKNMNANVTIFLLYKLMKLPLYDTILFLYPKWYDIYSVNTRIRCSMDRIETNKCYLLNDGCYVKLLVFDGISTELRKMLFGVSTNEELESNDIRRVDEGWLASDENGRDVLEFLERSKKENFGTYLPLVVQYCNRESYKKHEFVNEMVEDAYWGENSYPDFLFSLHQLIEKKFQ